MHVHAKCTMKPYQVEKAITANDYIVLGDKGTCVVDVTHHTPLVHRCGIHLRKVTSINVP